MKPHPEEDFLNELRAHSAASSEHLSVDKRRELFQELDKRQGGLAGWIWKLLGLSAVAAACWMALIHFKVPEAEVTEETVAQQIVDVPQEAITPAPKQSIFKTWKQSDPIDTRLQQLQHTLRKTERSALLSSKTSPSARESSLRQRMQRLRNDLS